MKRYLCFPLVALALTLLLTVSALAAGSRGKIAVVGTDGTVTVGLRAAGPGTSYQELVYTNDGVNWSKGETPEDFFYAYRGYYAGGKFWLCSRSREMIYPQEFWSADGIHWSRVEHDQAVADVPLGMTELGGYHFELSDGSLWLSRTDNSGRAVALPAFDEPLKHVNQWHRDVKAYYGPNDTVVVELYDLMEHNAPDYTIAYPTSSLEWCLDNLAEARYIDFTRKATNGTVTLGQRVVGNGRDDGRHNDIVYSYDDLHYARVPDAPWGGSCELLPYNGRTFLVRDRINAELYASADGVHWQNLRGTYLRPDLPENTYRWAGEVNCRMQWTGVEYITCQNISEGTYSMPGQSAGGNWTDPVSTKVCFADENFKLTGSYDFGRQVVGVGYYNGAWYAQVEEDDATTALYVSKDKQTWSKTEFIQILESVQTWN